MNEQYGCTPKQKDDMNPVLEALAFTLIAGSMVLVILSIIHSILTYIYSRRGDTNETSRSGQK